MGRTSQVLVRIEPEIKEEAEAILHTMGLTASDAVNLFYKQIIIQKGMPFPLSSVKLSPDDKKKLSAMDRSESSQADEELVVDNFDEDRYGKPTGF